MNPPAPHGLATGRPLTVDAPSLGTLIFRPSSITDRLNITALFPVPQPLEVELGSGDGSFLATLATRRSETNFIGVERLLGRLRKLDRKGLRAGLSNLRLLRLEAWYVLEYLLPPGSTRVLHVYFPDPWPKRRHRKNRLVNERFVESAFRALEVGGLVYLRTDDADYFDAMKAAFAAQETFRPVATPEDLAGVVTDFERDFLSRGISTLRAAYERL